MSKEEKFTCIFKIKGYTEDRKARTAEGDKHALLWKLLGCLNELAIRRKIRNHRAIFLEKKHRLSFDSTNVFFFFKNPSRLTIPGFTICKIFSCASLLAEV